MTKIYARHPSGDCQIISSEVQKKVELESSSLYRWYLKSMGMERMMWKDGMEKKKKGYDQFLRKCDTQNV